MMGHRGDRRLGGLLLLVMTAGCDAISGTAPDLPHHQGAAKVGGDVVSTVDGVPITTADVQQLVNTSELSPQEALMRLQTEALLMGEAERRGYAQRAEVRSVARQALVQALLVREVESLAATPEEIELAYARERTRFELPDRREAVHVLAVLGENASAEAEQAARAFAARAARAFAEAQDPSAVMTAFRDEKSPHFQVKAEVLPLAAQDRYVPAFSAALFASRGVGAVPDPVRTEFGFHAIYVTGIAPAETVPREIADAELAKEITARKRDERAAKLLATLRNDEKVVYAPAGRDALKAPEL